MNKNKILGMGNAVLDIIFSCTEENLEKLNLKKGQMAIVGENISDETMKKFMFVKKSSGGSVANTIAGISILGGSSAFCGRVCNDEIGKDFIDDINKIGVDFLCSPVTNSPPTAKCLVFVTEDGERTMQTFLGASIHLDEKDIKEEHFNDISKLIIEGYLWSSESARLAIDKAINIAKKKKIEVFFSLSDSGLVKMYKKEFLEFINKDVDFLIGNKNEFSTLFGQTELKQLAQSASNIVSKSVMTNGEDGAVLFMNNDFKKFDSEKNDSVIDSTGAGDMFAAGLLYYLSDGKSLDHSIEYGCKVASRILSKYGARPDSAIL
jgi:sugar/nucleoside kinase (ribokinase family)